jgi:hydroxymethylpyrimidine/phosphomethylpyrimidine kinase
MKTLLTIGGFDPSSGAGVTADLAVMASMGMFGTSCITALTVQSTLGVKSVHAVDPTIVEETLTWLAQDMPPAGIKIGMLGTAGVVSVVGSFLQRHPNVPVVLDPVVRSSSGKALLDEEGLDAMRRELLGRVNWVTPNIAELAAMVEMQVDGPHDVERASFALGRRWPKLNIVATGGHLDAPDDFIRLSDGREKWIRGEWIDSTATHGTGCAFSTTLLCNLVDGLDEIAAVKKAKAFVAEGIRLAERRGTGNGPMELYWPLRNLES